MTLTTCPRCGMTDVPMTDGRINRHGTNGGECKPTEPETRYSDEWLDWAATGAAGRGYQNAAPLFREIPFEHRQRASSLALGIMNRIGTTYSDAVWSAICELRNANFGETVTERDGREWRENEREHRRAIWQAEARAFARSQGWEVK